jgi:hypothetical protein
MYRFRDDKAMWDRTGIWRKPGYYRIVYSHEYFLMKMIESLPYIIDYNLCALAEPTPCRSEMLVRMLWWHLLTLHGQDPQCII